MKIFADNIPIYLQLKTEVETAILSGGLKAEDGIDSIRAMAAKYSINPLTVSKAIQELESEGIIYKKRGIGFYVSPDALTNLRSKHMQAYLDTEVKSFVQKARQLELTLAEIVKLVEQNYKVAGSNYTGGTDNPVREQNNPDKTVIPAQAGIQPVLSNKGDRLKDMNDESNPAPHPDHEGLRPSTPDNKEKEK
ncbi:MAG: GntR family transcriptional regulator [Candidatus Cloacimonadaceae bacterium]